MSSDVRTFTCPHCGATQTFDPALRTLSCPFCGTNLVLDTAPDSPGASVPPDQREIIPFALTRDDALLRVRYWFGAGGFFAPNDLATRATPDVVSGVYVPCYTYTCRVVADWTGAYPHTDRQTTFSWRLLRTQTTTITVWVPHGGQYEGTHTALVAASLGVPQAEIDALLPYEFGRAVWDAPEYLAGFVAEQPSTTALRAWQQCGNAHIHTQVTAACAHQTARLQQVQWAPTDWQAWLVWLPVWIYGYQYRSRYYRVVLNGQTGKISGARPRSPAKIAAAAVVLLILVGLLLFVLSLVPPDMTSLSGNYTYK